MVRQPDRQERAAAPEIEDGADPTAERGGDAAGLDGTVPSGPSP